MSSKLDFSNINPDDISSIKLDTSNMNKNIINRTKQFNKKIKKYQEETQEDNEDLDLILSYTENTKNKDNNYDTNSKSSIPKINLDKLLNYVNTPTEQDYIQIERQAKDIFKELKNFKLIKTNEIEKQSLIRYVNYNLDEMSYVCIVIDIIYDSHGYIKYITLKNNKHRWHIKPIKYYIFHYMGNDYNVIKKLVKKLNSENDKTDDILKEYVNIQKNKYNGRESRGQTK